MELSADGWMRTHLAIASVEFSIPASIGTKIDTDEKYDLAGSLD